MEKVCYTHESQSVLRVWSHRSCCLLDDQTYESSEDCAGTHRLGFLFSS